MADESEPRNGYNHRNKSEMKKKEKKKGKDYGSELGDIIKSIMPILDNFQPQNINHHERTN